MRVLAHIHGYPPAHCAGAEWAMHGVLCGLIARGHTATVYCPSRAVATELDGVRVHVDLPTAALQRLYAEADIVLTHLDLTRRVCGMAAHLGKPVAHYVHNGSQLSYHNVTADDAALVVWNSDWLRIAGKWRGREVVVWPPVRAERYLAGDGPHNAIALLNINANKGANTFWQLARRCRARSFLAVRGAYEVQSVPTPTPRNVAVQETQADVRDIYRQTRIVLMPSEYESWGRVAMEAAVNGIPTICHPTPGLQECLGEAGIYCDRQDIPAYVAALKRLDGQSAYAAASDSARNRYLWYERENERQLDALEVALRETLADWAPVAEPDRRQHYTALRTFRHGDRVLHPGDLVAVPERIARVLERRGIVEKWSVVE